MSPRVASSNPLPSATRTALSSIALPLSTALSLCVACGESSLQGTDAGVSTVGAGAAGASTAGRASSSSNGGGSGGSDPNPGGAAGRASTPALDDAGAGGAPGGSSAGGNAAGGTETDGGVSSAGAGGADNPLSVPDTDGLCQITMRCAEEILDEPKVLCDLEITGAPGGPTYAASAGVELRGRSSQSFPKKNYAVELRDESGEENPFNLLGMGKESDWIFDGAWADRSLMRNALVFDLFRDLSDLHYAAESRYCTLTLDGVPQGIYRLVEKIKRDDDRVALTDDDGAGSSFVIKQDADGVVPATIVRDEYWQVIYPRQDSATPAQLAGVEQWLEGLSAALRGGSPSDPETGVFAYLDFDVAVDWVLLQELSKNVDGYTLSLHLARDAGGLARLIPWDFDLTFGQPTVAPEQEGQPDPAPNELPAGWIRNRTVLIRSMAAVAEFRARLATRWAELRASTFADAAITARLDGYQARLTDEALAQNFAIWPIEDVDFVEIYTPYSFYDVTSHAEEMTALRSWITARLEWMDANVATYPGGG